MLPMINNVSEKTISNDHLDQLTELVITTGPFQHKPKDSEHIKNEIVLKYLPYTRIILDDLQNIAGFYIALAKSNDLEPSINYSWCDLGKDKDAFSSILNAIGELNNLIGEDDHILHYFAVRPDLRGSIYPRYNAKIADLLFADLLANTVDQGHHLCFMVWETHQAAIKFYKRYKAVIVQEADLKQTLLDDRLFLMKIAAR